MEQIDPRQYGQLEEQVAALRREVDSMSRDMKDLLALANKSKGGFWMGMTVASLVGGLITWFIDHFVTR